MTVLDKAGLQGLYVVTERPDLIIRVKQGLEAGNREPVLEMGRNKDWKRGMLLTSRKRAGFLDAVPNLMGTSKKGGLFLEVGSDVDGDLRRLRLVSVRDGHKASRASLQAELARLALSGRPWFRPDTVTGKRELEERSEREKWKREVKERKNSKILALVRTGLAL